MGTFQAPSDNWAGGSRPNRDRPHSVLMMVVGAGLLGSGCLAGLVTGWVAGSANRFSDLIDSVSAPVNMGVSVKAPKRVTVGEPFDLKVIVDNLGETELYIATVDLNGAVCDQFEVTNVEPAADGHTVQYGWHEYTYSLTVPRDRQSTFVFSMKGKVPGSHGGEISVYVGDEFQSLSRPVSIVVEPAGDS